MHGTSSTTPGIGVDTGAGRLPLLVIGLDDSTPVEDLVPGRQPVVLSFPGGAFEGSTCPRWGHLDSSGARFELMELEAGQCTIVDLVAELVAAPRRAWSRADAELVADVLAERPGYALQLRWRSAREPDDDGSCLACGAADYRRNEDQLVPAFRGVEPLLHEHYGIDPQKLDDEKRAMVAAGRRERGEE